MILRTVKPKINTNYVLTETNSVCFRAHDLLTFYPVFSQMLFMQIGENDLTHADVSPHNLAKDIVTLAQEFLTRSSVTSVIIIGQLLWRAPHRAPPDYNNQVIETNVVLHQLVHVMENIKCWHHHGFWSEDLSLLSVDGVHLNKHANQKIFTEHKE